MRPIPATLSFGSGVLLALAYPGRDWDLLAWVALVPLFAATRRATPRAAFGYGWIAGTTCFLISLPWVVHAIVHYTWLPIFVALVPYGLMSAALGCYTGASASLWTAMSRRGVPALLAVPVTWVALEWVRTYFPIGFPWLLLGYATHGRLALMQLADLAGIYGLSFLIAFVNAALFEALRAPAPAARLVRVGLAAGVLFVAVGYGQWRLRQIAALPHSQSLRVALIQGNIEQEHKWDPAYQTQTIDRYQQLSQRTVARHPQVVIWPETAAPFFFQLQSPERERVAAVARHIGSALLFGSPAFDYDAAGRSYMTNRAYALGPSGEIVGSYDKQILVPFGEYVPLGAFLPFVGRMVESAAPFRPGPGSTPLALGSQRYGVLICYEAIFPQLARRMVRQGATVLANLTNDAWFGRTVAPDQQLAMAAFRAVENRRPLLRAANTGYSAVVDVDGRIRDRTALFTTTEVEATIAWPRLTAPYTIWGDWLAFGCAAGAFLGAAACIVRPRRGISSPEAEPAWN